MSNVVRYLTHPQVKVDPDLPIGQWGLNERGRARVAFLTTARVLTATRSVISSAETKAIETGEPLAKALGCRFEIRADMHENDRSSTGFLEPEAFDRTVEAFFEHPHESIDGWERAIDAQHRICRAVEEALKLAPAGDVLFVGHGAVGTLLWCSLAGKKISRAHDQIEGGGNAFAFERATHEVLSGWVPIEQL